MSNKEYEQIVSQVSSEILMKLEQIKMFLSQEKASVMVGAGFSMNAHQTAFAKMKDWNGLSEALFDQLFPKDEDKKRNSYLQHDPLRVSQMYECCFGRNALDELIKSSLPNECAKPGALHESLMNLKWCDVFTTNYDTLLERAAEQINKAYHIVTNKETLLYAEKPRIIKLHGSFPDIRPFIITEEDFRTYPQKYPEFVNTVRQALMESVFCLIGFSGNDPNFLQWIGWLRDVMGNQVQPVYLITHDKNLHKAQVDLFKRRGVEIINLADLKEGIGYSDGLAFVLRYLGEDRSKKWEPIQLPSNLKTIDAIISATEKMEEERKSYPNYFYLPEQHHLAFENQYPYMRWTDSALLPQLTRSQRLHFIYELVWQYEVSLSPIIDEWIWEDMKEIAFDEEPCEWNEIYYKTEIQLSYLTLMRMGGNDAEFAQLIRKIEVNKLTEAQRHRFCYEQCLQGLGLLDYAKVKALLQEWEVNGTDVRSSLWKAVVLLEIGKDEEAHGLLKSTSEWCRRALLTHKDAQQVSAGYMEVLEKVIQLHEIKIMSDTGLDNLEKRLMNKLVTEKDKPNRLYEDIHKFGIDNIQSTWHSETNESSLLLYAYKYVRLLEVVGYPLGMNGLLINEPWLKSAIVPLFQNFPTYALRVLLRSRSNKTMLHCLTRENIIHIPMEWADEQYEIYKEKINTYISSNENRGAYVSRVADVLIPAFARLSPRLGMAQTSSLWEQYYKYFNSGKYGYDRADFVIIQDNMFAEERVRANSLLYGANEESSDRSLPWQSLWMPLAQVANEDVDILAAHIKNLDGNEESLTMVRAYYMLIADLKPAQKRKMERTIRIWRSKNEDNHAMSDILNTYQLVDYDKHLDTKRVEYYLDKVVDAIGKMQTEKIRSTSPLNELMGNLGLLSPFAKQIPAKQNEIIIRTFYQVLANNKKLFQKDDSSMFLGGMRTRLQRLCMSMFSYLYDADLQGVDTQVLSDMIDVCVEYSGYNVATIGLVARLNNELNRFNEEKMERLINSVLLGDNYHVYSSGLQAIRMTNSKSVRENLVEAMIKYAEFAQNRKMKSIVFTIMCLIEDGQIEKDIWHERIDDFISRLAEVVCNMAGEEYVRMDIMYYTNLLAGVMSAKWGNSKGTDQWKQISLDKKNFNDVRVGFDIGQSRVITSKKELLERLVVKKEI